MQQRDCGHLWGLREGGGGGWCLEYNVECKVNEGCGKVS